MRNLLHAICPYFAMFPETFVEEQLEQHSREGDLVLDPFSGRGTTLLQSLLMNRNAVAIDINPVAYCISAAKAHVPGKSHLLLRLSSLERSYSAGDPDPIRQERANLPPFFRRAFHYDTLAQLLFFREHLRWRESRVDCFLAAVILGILHGESTRSRRYLSNQMPRTISTKPAYSLKWWKDRNLWPKKRDVFNRLREEVDFRLRSQVPSLHGRAVLGDARQAAQRFPRLQGAVTAVITSPPYFDVTSSEEDQWLRLWFLGYDPRPTYRRISKDDRYEVKGQYWRFLSEVWQGIAPLIRKDGVLVCRLGGSGMAQTEITSGITASLVSAFSSADLISGPRESELLRRQTPSFRPGTAGYRFEVDYVFRVG